MTFDSILILIIAVASLAFKPGPGMAAIVARAIENGFLSAFLVSMGAITIEILYFVVAYFGFSFIEGHLPFLIIILKVIGSIYIFYLAYEAFQKSKVIPKSNEKIIKQPYLKDYLAGVTITLANPLVILVYLAIIPTVLDLSTIDINGLTLALLIIFNVNLILLTALSALATQVRVMLADKFTVQKFNLTSAILLCGVGVYILYGLIKAI